jgi:Inhibitor of apoptosis-promoting Bax1
LAGNRYPRVFRPQDFEYLAADDNPQPVHRPIDMHTLHTSRPRSRGQFNLVLPDQRHRWTGRAVRNKCNISQPLDAGLRRYMLSVYNYMAVGLCLTGLVAVIAVADGLYQQIAGTPLIWLVMLAPLAAVGFLSFRIERMNVATAHAIFWVYAGLMGLSLADILLV